MRIGNSLRKISGPAAYAALNSSLPSADLFSRSVTEPVCSAGFPAAIILLIWVTGASTFLLFCPLFQKIARFRVIQAPRAASDESRLDPFSAALRSISFLAPAQKEKNCGLFHVEDDSFEYRVKLAVRQVK